MSLPQIRDEYRVPARLGARVRFGVSLQGVIAGSCENHLDVTLDDGREVIVHPEDVIYLTEPA